jgi:threonine/homoserine/homoserine lactone efflux protein
MLEILSLREFIALLIFCTVMTFSPGPNTMLTTAIAANDGFRRTLPFTLAVPVGWLFIMMACGLGIGTLVTQMPIIRYLIQFLGCAYLIWLAFKLSQSSQLKEVNLNKLNMGFFKGVIFQFLNIKVWLLALTITSAWVIHAEGIPSSNPEQRLIVSCVVMMCFAFASNMSYAIAGSVVRVWLSSGKRLLFFNRFLALILALTALWTLTV